VNYVYGQDGQRAAKYTAQSETLYFNKMWSHHTDGGNAYLGGHNIKNIYLGETRIVTKLAAGHETTVHEEVYKQFYYHSDHLGSAALITDYRGDEYQRLEYTPYGEVWVEEQKVKNEALVYLPYKFTGKERDEETGLYYYGARYLDAKYSRWLSTDPALGEYIPKAGKGTADEAGKLAGQGGIFNSVNQSLYNYASNNPIKYSDPDGRNPIAIAVCWAAAFASAATAAYFATPSGQKGLQDLAEALSYGAQAANQAVSNAINNTVECVKTNVEYYNTAKAKAKELAKEYTDRKSTGSYTITFASGKTYSGKGGVKRAIESAAFRSTVHTTMPVGIDWTPAASQADAFEDEYIRIQEHGGPMSKHPDQVIKNVHPNYNVIQSPGETIYLIRHGTLYDEKNPNAME